jgi:hypothetical protein
LWFEVRIPVIAWVCLQLHAVVLRNVVCFRVTFRFPNPRNKLEISKRGLKNVATTIRTKKAKKRRRTNGIPGPPEAQEKPEGSDLRSDKENKTGSFTPKTLDRTVIAIPLLLELDRAAEKEPGKIFSVVVDLNLMFPGGKTGAKSYVDQKIQRILRDLKKTRWLFHISAQARR